MRRSTLPTLLGALLLAGAGTLAGCSPGGGASGPSPSSAAAAYLGAWGRTDWTAMAQLVEGSPPGFAAANKAALATLGVRSASYTAAPSGAVVHGTRASLSVTEHLHLVDFGTWAVHTTLRLQLVHGRWRIAWSPATINPAFGADGQYRVSHRWPARAQILEANGTPISPAVPTSVVIGLEGTYIKDAASVATSLEKAGASASATGSAVAAAGADPTAFEPVFTVSWARFQQLQPTLEPIPGVFFQSQGGSGSTPAALAAVVGTLGTITRSQLKQLGPPYTASSIVGEGGLEQAYERQLAGTPGLTISVSHPGERGGKLLKTFPARRGTDVRTTIDPTVEQDAVNALAGAPGNEAAFVAIQASTGEIIAVVNTSQTDDLALTGAQPPGSTMKILTSTALIEKGLNPQSPVTCPATLNVDGENFHNAGGEGYVPNMFQAFTVSCNTAFIGLTVHNLDFHSLHDAAHVYRIGTPLGVGMPVFSGSVPVNNGETDFAASAIGQARVLMNPLDLAMVAADVDAGTVRTPFLTFGAPAERQAVAKLPPNLVTDLHEMMLSVVQRGTAAGTGLPPGTYAKTGSAEYGTVRPLPLDGWLAGFNGNIAFAMIDVHAPGDGGPVDGPMVTKFFDAVLSG